MWKNVAVPMLLVIAFWLLSSVVTAYYIRGLEALPSRMILEDVSTIRAADRMRYVLGQLDRLMAAAPRPVSPENAAKVRQFEAAFQLHLNEAIATANSAEELGIDHEIGDRFHEFSAEIDRQIREPAKAGPDAGNNVRRLLALAGKVAEPEVRLGDVNEKSMRELATSESPAARSLTYIRNGLMVMGPAAGILCGFWMTRRFYRSISRISITLNDVASEMQEHVGRVVVRETGGLPRLQQQVEFVLARIRKVVQQLNEARRQAINAARLAAVGEMAAGVAHELRNPLTSVKLLIQAGAQRADRRLTEKQFSVVLEEICRMENTIERMLDFARPPRMNGATRDLRDILQRAVSLVEHRAQQGHVDILLHMPADPVDVNADLEQLHQVFTNLLNNAIEAMPAGGKLGVTIDPATPDSKCRVRFVDSGPGVSPAIMERIFEPFVTDKARGTGLGLAVSHRIMRDHEGTLIAENRAEGGAMFTVEIPLQSTARSSASATGSVSPAARDSSFATESHHAQVAHH